MVCINCTTFISREITRASTSGNTDKAEISNLCTQLAKHGPTRPNSSELLTHLQTKCMFWNSSQWNETQFIIYLQISRSEPIQIWVVELYSDHVHACPLTLYEIFDFHNDCKSFFIFPSQSESSQYSSKDNTTQRNYIYNRHIHHHERQKYSSYWLRYMYWRCFRKGTRVCWNQKVLHIHQGRRNWTSSQF
jgi:hypothetical protein